MHDINAKLGPDHKVYTRIAFSDLFADILIKINVSGQPGIRSRFATITILVPPEPPRILQGDFLVTTEDREIELECVSVGGKPAAEVI